MAVLSDAELLDELGDVLYGVQASASILGVSLEELAEMNKEKLERRRNGY